MVMVADIKPTYWLSMHVPYACRHSGACCSSGWDIPIERSRVTAVGVLRQNGSWLRAASGAPSDVAGFLALSETGHCVFHRDGCEIHRALGHRALPSACQHFPREVLIDLRGTFVTLSHYCPTAAELLFTHVGPVEIVVGPPAVPEGEPEGLDARDVLPPVLWAGTGGVHPGQPAAATTPRHAGVLMDLESYSAWEAHMVQVLTASDGNPAESALSTLERDLATLQRWRPGNGALSGEVVRLRGRHAADRRWTTRPAAPSLSAIAEEDVIRRYLAARAFASWTAYAPGGVEAVVQSLRDALSLVRQLRRKLSLRAAIREADRQLVHLAPRRGLRNC